MCINIKPEHGNQKDFLRFSEKQILSVLESQNHWSFCDSVPRCLMSVSAPSPSHRLCIQLVDELLKEKSARLWDVLKDMCTDGREESQPHGQTCSNECHAQNLQVFCICHPPAAAMPASNSHSSSTQECMALMALSTDLLNNIQFPSTMFFFSKFLQKCFSHISN